MSDDDLNERLKAAGMFTIDQMLGVTPMSKFTIVSGMDNLEFFGAWLDRRTREFLQMRVAYELGDKPKDDPLYEWVLAHSATLLEVRENFMAAKAGGIDVQQAEASEEKLRGENPPPRAE